MSCDPRRSGLGALDDALVSWDDAGVLDYVGTFHEAPEALRARAGEPLPLITPGLVDAHTHAAWMGSRHHEYQQRMRGEGYEAIAAAGGGIQASARAVAAASEDAIAAELDARLLRMAAMGVTTVEVKSGYGLVPEQELKQLRAIARVSARADRPRVIASFLALHALPQQADRDDYVREAARLVDAVAAQGLARYVDVYVDRNAFRVDEAEHVAAAAQRAGLGLRAHVGQFADVGGAAWAASRGAASVDHLEHVGLDDARALAAAGTAAVLLPIASFTLAQPPPPVARLREAGVTLVVASDANPGTAPSESLPLAMALAVRSYALSPEETWLGATRHAAASLGLGGRCGALAVGWQADLVAWELPHEDALLQPWGVSRARKIVRAGVPLGVGA